MCENHEDKIERKKTPVIAEILAAITVACALSPIDLEPDYVSIPGYLYDMIILPVLIDLTIKCISKDIWVDSKEKSVGMCSRGKW